MTLDEILDPVPRDEFLRTYGKGFVRVAGKRGRFISLLPWAELNSILSHHRLRPPRLRLARDGKVVDGALYVDSSRSSRGRTNSRLVPEALLKQLRDGATLVVDAMDEMSDGIRAVAEALEREFHEHVQANAYASWGTSRGFDIHWDDHDVLVLQLVGEKRWSIYEPTRMYPLYPDSDRRPPLVEPPFWDGLLQDGDVLYIPRGWWHEAHPVGALTLHVTFGIRNRIGTDYLTWLVDQLKQEEIFRQDLPKFGGDADLRRHLERLKMTVAARLTMQDLRGFLHEHDASAANRGRFSFPWAATPEVIPSSGKDFWVRWTAIRFSLTETRESIEIAANGKSLKLAKELRPIVDLLTTGSGYAFENLARRLDTIPIEHLRVVISQLVVKGFASIENPGLR